MTNVTEGATMTTEEAGRLATGLVGAAAAERDAWAPPPRHTKVEHVTVAVEPGLAPAAKAYTYAGAGESGWVGLGPLTLSGEWDVLEATLAAALDAVRVARQGPVGA